MPLFVELYEADQWLYGTLAGDSTLAGLVSGIFDTEAPPNQTGVYVVFNVQSPGVDVRASGRLGTGRIVTTPLYLVRAIGATTAETTIKAAALRFDQLLEGITTATVNGNHISWQRESPFKHVEHQGPQQKWRHLGGLYRAYISGP